MKFNKSFMLSLCAATLLTASVSASQAPAQAGKIASIVNFFKQVPSSVKNRAVSAWNFVTPKVTAEYAKLTQSIKERNFTNFATNKIVVGSVATTAVVGSLIAYKLIAKKRAQKKAALAPQAK